jgi:hypothetical protein
MKGEVKSAKKLKISDRKGADMPQSTQKARVGLAG